MKTKLFQTIAIFFLLAPIAAAQTGGAFTIEKSVIASGGGTIAGGAFTVLGTAGQPAAGNAQGGAFTVFGGFITPSFAPTAASVTIGGRVRTEKGKGIRNARVTLTDANGATRAVLSGTFGAYRFADVAVGETYILFVSGKRFVFANPTQIVNVVEQLDDLDFIGTEQW